jgi:hypothetical protein
VTCQFHEICLFFSEIFEATYPARNLQIFSRSRNKLLLLQIFVHGRKINYLIQKSYCDYFLYFCCLIVKSLQKCTLFTLFTLFTFFIFAKFFFASNYRENKLLGSTLLRYSYPTHVQSSWQHPPTPTITFSLSPKLFCMRKT